MGRVIKHETYLTELYSEFAAERLIFDARLVVPLRLLYQEFLKRDRLLSEGFPADVFVSLLQASGVEIKGGGRGKLKRVAIGVGIRPTLNAG